MNIRIEDVRAPLRRNGVTEFMGQDITQPDWRLIARTPTGGEVTFHRGATADEVAAYWECKGWPV